MECGRESPSDAKIVGWSGWADTGGAEASADCRLETAVRLPAKETSAVDALNAEPANRSSGCPNGVAAWAVTTSRSAAATARHPALNIAQTCSIPLKIARKRQNVRGWAALSAHPLKASAFADAQ